MPDRELRTYTVIRDPITDDVLAVMDELEFSVVRRSNGKYVVRASRRVQRVRYRYPAPPPRQS